MKKENKKPVDTKKFGSVVASIWQNETKEGRTFHSVTVQRFYKPKDATEWSYSTSFDRDDLPQLKEAIDAAYAWFFTERLESQKEPS